MGAGERRGGWMTASAFGAIAAILSAAVFAVASVSKALCPAETTAAFEALGVRSAASMARLVPLVEAVTAVALVVAPPIGAAMGLFLLVAFTAILVEVIRRGVRVRCACFGAASSHSVSVADLARNAGLVMLAIVALWSQTPPHPTWSAAIAVCLAALAWGVAVAAVRRRVTTPAS